MSGEAVPAVTPRLLYAVSTRPSVYAITGYPMVVTMEPVRILLIDDEVEFTRLLQLNLLEAGDYDVCTANTGQAGIALARACLPSLIFLDISMPGMTGDQVAQMICQDPTLKDIPIVFLTATLRKDEIGSGSQRIGNDVFIAKPVVIDEIIACIKQYADRL
jgi:CheY-like chemotaxis protein